jgi:KTSC domain
VRMQAIESEAINAVGYDAQHRILRVTFHNGQSYEYLDVSSEEFRDFMSAESRGAYMNRVIKPKYECRNV